MSRAEVLESLEVERFAPRPLPTRDEVADAIAAAWPRARRETRLIAADAVLALFRKRGIR